MPRSVFHRHIYNDNRPGFLFDRVAAANPPPPGSTLVETLCTSSARQRKISAHSSACCIPKYARLRRIFATLLDSRGTYYGSSRWTQIPVHMMPSCLSGAHDDVVKKSKWPSVATAIRLPTLTRSTLTGRRRDWPPSISAGPRLGAEQREPRYDRKARKDEAARRFPGEMTSNVVASKRLIRLSGPHEMVAGHARLIVSLVAVAWAG